MPSAPPGTSPTKCASVGPDNMTEPVIAPRQLPAKQWCIRFLMAEFGWDGCQARRMYEAHVHDTAVARWLGTSDVPDDDRKRVVKAWMLREMPLGLKRARKVTKREWRTAS